MFTRDSGFSPTHGGRDLYHTYRMYHTDGMELRHRPKPYHTDRSSVYRCQYYVI
jgi:hypothetical protein